MSETLVKTVLQGTRYAFAPGYGPDAKRQEIRLVFEGLAGYYQTSMTAPDLETAEAVCRKLNRQADIAPQEADAIVTSSMNAQNQQDGAPADEAPPKHRTVSLRDLLELHLDTITTIQQNHAAAEPRLDSPKTARHRWRQRFDAIQARWDALFVTLRNRINPKYGGEPTWTGPTQTLQDHYVDRPELLGIPEDE